MKDRRKTMDGRGIVVVFRITLIDHLSAPIA
jgi:hypothetical protein